MHQQTPNSKKGQNRPTLQTKPLKIHGLSCFDLRFTVGLEKCFFEYEDGGKNERNQWHILMIEKKCSQKPITFLPILYICSNRKGFASSRGRGVNRSLPKKLVIS